jgi:GTP cyclohydrolase I
LKWFNSESWNPLAEGINKMLSDPAIASTLPYEHYKDTPTRFVDAMQELFSGCLETPREIFETGIFENEEKYQQMVHVKRIRFYSTCAHHLLGFAGSCSFAYIPQNKIVGLSKIPRLIQMYSRRPQIQEKLSMEITNAFMEWVEPQGCGLIMRATHLCMGCRGVKAHEAFTETTSLCGSFMTPDVKGEFIIAANSMQTEAL